MDGACMDSGGFDLAYFSEVDPMWDDDTLAFIMNPEAILFGNPVAQLSCSTDAIASMTGLPLDPLFWCAGAQGSVYPLTGWIATDVSEPSNAVLMDERMNAKLHRMGMILDSVPGYICHSLPTFVLPKSHYRYEFVNPVAEPKNAFQYGRSTSLVSDRLEGTLSSKDNFGILNFKKRNCCFM
jgi:conjugal transfer pilus assembly protein TraU